MALGKYKLRIQYNRMNKKVATNSADTLEQKLITTRYSVVDELISVRDSLSKEQLQLNHQKQKISQLRQKLQQLQNADKLNHKTAAYFQTQTYKLETTQAMAVALMALKVDNAKDREQRLDDRRNSCSEMRTSNSQSKSMALSIFEKRKTARIQRIRKEEHEQELLKKRMNESDSQYRRIKSNQIRQSEINGRERLRRYEQFRLAQARFNYEQKKSELLRAHAEKLNLLKELKMKVGSADEIFEKTKLLNKEASESYLNFDIPRFIDHLSAMDLGQFVKQVEVKEDRAR